MKGLLHLKLCDLKEVRMNHPTIDSKESETGVWQEKSLINPNIALLWQREEIQPTLFVLRENPNDKVEKCNGSKRRVHGIIIKEEYSNRLYSLIKLFPYLL